MTYRTPTGTSHTVDVLEREWNKLGMEVVRLGENTRRMEEELGHEQEQLITLIAKREEIRLTLQKLSPGWQNIAKKGEAS